MRTRIRGAHRVRTCLVCGAIRRQPFQGPFTGPGPVDVTTRWTKGPEEVLAEEPSDVDEEAADLGSEEDE